MSIWINTTCYDKWNIICCVKMFNVTDNKLKSIKRIKIYILGGVDVIMTSDFIKHPLWQIVKSFKISKIMLMH